MASFRYTGRNQQGERVSGSLQGNSADAVASALNAVLAQRLVRRVCENCMEEHVPEPQQLLWLERCTVVPWLVAHSSWAPAAISATTVAIRGGSVFTSCWRWMSR